jgi:hypothetical protein
VSISKILKENGSRNLTIKIPSKINKESENQDDHENDYTIDILKYIVSFIGSAKIIIRHDAK